MHLLLFKSSASRRMQRSGEEDRPLCFGLRLLRQEQERWLAGPCERSNRQLQITSLLAVDLLIDFAQNPAHCCCSWSTSELSLLLECCPCVCSPKAASNKCRHRRPATSKSARQVMTARLLASRPRRDQDGPKDGWIVGRSDAYDRWMNE